MYDAAFTGVTVETPDLCLTFDDVLQHFLLFPVEPDAVDPVFPIHGSEYCLDIHDHFISSREERRGASRRSL